MPETEKMALILVIIHGIATCTLWAPSFMMPNVLKGAGDVKYTMVISAGSMWVFRILLCMVFGRYTNWGIYGVWAAMMIDWVARGVSFVGRYCTNKWYNKKAI
jgi:Na+-driven multidrug efflux pump